MKSVCKVPRKGRPKLSAEVKKSILVPVKFDIDRYEIMSHRALDAGMNRSEYIRHSSTHCKVVERLTPRDLKAIRDLQGISQNLNTIAKFFSAMLKGADPGEEKIFAIMKELSECRAFVLSLIKIYRRTPDETLDEA